MDAAFASQSAHLQGMAQFTPPDMILREDRLAEDLAMLCLQVGIDEPPDLMPVTDPHAKRLAAILDDELQAMARDAYLRDFVSFGFGRWTPKGQAA